MFVFVMLFLILPTYFRISFCYKDQQSSLTDVYVSPHLYLIVLQRLKRAIVSKFILLYRNINFVSVIVVTIIKVNIEYLRKILC